MSACVPIQDVKDPAAFSRIVMEEIGPATVTEDGRDLFVVMRPDAYEAMQTERAEARLLARIAQAENDYGEGRMKDGPAAMAELKEQYGA